MIENAREGDGVADDEMAAHVIVLRVIRNAHYMPDAFKPSVDAAITAMQAQQGAEPVAWQPIETAPKDQAFLAVLDCGGDQIVCTMRWPVAEAKNSAGAHGFIRDRVTHWMPLPAAPVTGAPR